ncbi:MAG: MFS transporter [Stappiaceae bacterium]
MGGELAGKNRVWWLLGALSGVMGLIVLDETVVGTALPTIRSDLSMTTVGSHWVVNAYLLTFTCFVAAAGRLSDRLGHKQVFLIGASLFALASLGAGLTPGGTGLIIARGLQGIGAALLFPTSIAMVTASFPLEKRGKAFGIQTTVGAVFMSSGPLVGGLFSQVISWRAVFLINVPIVAGIVLLVIALWQDPPVKDEKEATDPPFDVKGFITLLFGLVALTIFLMQGTDWGWINPLSLMMLVAGLGLLAGFYIYEFYNSQPLIELDLLTIRPFAGGVLSFFSFQFNKIVIFVFVAMFLQEKVGLSPINSGLLLMIGILPTLGTSLIAGKLADKYGSRPPLLFGFTLNGLAVLAIAFLSYIETYWVFLPLIIWGATLPFCAIPARRTLMSAVPKTKLGQASGVNLTVQMVGGTIGIALCGSIIASTGAYWLAFLLTSVLILTTTLVINALIEVEDTA